MSMFQNVFLYMSETQIYKFFEETEFLNNPILTWILFFLFTFLIFFTLTYIRNFLIKRSMNDQEKNSTFKVDLRKACKKTKPYFLALLALYVSSHVLSISPSIERTLDKIFIIGLFVQIGFWADFIIRLIFEHYFHNEFFYKGNFKTPTSKAIMLIFVSRFIIVSILLLLMLDNLGINVTALITGLGIGGVAVALAVQRILGDLIASLSILLDKSFEVGDSIMAGDFNGTVEHVGFKTTRLRSVDGELLIISNSDLTQSRIRNFKKLTERRAIVRFEVNHQTSPDKLIAIKQIAKEILLKYPDVRFDRAHFSNITLLGFEFEIVFYVVTTNYAIFMDNKEAFLKELLGRIANEGVSLAHQNYLLKDRFE